MDISIPEENTGRSYLPNGVDGLGVATKKYLESGGQMSKLEPKERQNVSDSKVTIGHITGHCNHVNIGYYESIFNLEIGRSQIHFPRWSNRIQ